MHGRSLSSRSRRPRAFWSALLLALFSLLVISPAFSDQATSSPGNRSKSSSSPAQIAQRLYQDSTLLVRRLEERKRQQQALEQSEMQHRQDINALEMPSGQLQHQLSAMSGLLDNLDQGLTETSSSLDQSKASAESSSQHYEASLQAAEKLHRVDQVKLWIQRILLLVFGGLAAYFAIT